MWFLGSLWLVEFDAEFVSIFYITCDQGATGGSLDYYDDFYLKCTYVLFLSRCGLMISYKCGMSLLYCKL